MCGHAPQESPALQMLAFAAHWLWVLQEITVLCFPSQPQALSCLCCFYAWGNSTLSQKCWVTRLQVINLLGGVVPTGVGFCFGADCPNFSILTPWWVAESELHPCHCSQHMKQLIPTSQPSLWGCESGDPELFKGVKCSRDPAWQYKAFPCLFANGCNI